MKWFHTDNAPEFLTLRKEMNRMTVNSTTSSVYTPQSYGVAERLNRSLLGKARLLMKHTIYDSQYRGEILLQAAYLYNVNGTGALNLTTPHESLIETALFIKNVRLFGCPVYVHKHASQRSNKFDARAKRVIYMRNRDDMHRMYLSEGRKLVTTKHAAINEDESPHLSSQ